ncbi:alkane 1-monooxygenase [Salipiger sp. IMCC34102]|uniref:alkane 1-monooxygenase n=1 Tax=Salipiger sp. IMCC34102 TaxID=2510647 RepID=UPI00101DBE33|nr:alkane 1-monooxygenase [Salipiger sp. IMCC34102]RYH02378.1 alkane 1-monooxygenase [Salipiger sp. IMCC34102]
MRAMLLFTFATLIPVPLLATAALSGGAWIVAVLVYMTGLTYLLDQLVRIVTPPWEGVEFPAADSLSVVLALSHFALLGLVVRAVGHGDLGLAGSLGLIVATGLYFGQVSNSNAHELIHRGARPLHLLGRWVFISMLYGHHSSAHVLIHHRAVATEDDPATARLGEGFWSYVPRAWGGAFRAGLRAERARLDRIGRSRWHNPYVQYVAGSLAFCLAALALGGPAGFAAYLAIAAYAQVQLMLSDYVQHYGLTRKIRESGKPEPVGAAHSWNAPQWFSGALMLNAPRHSDHHAHPARPYPELTIEDGAPVLPRSLPAMATLAMIPPLWRRVMDKRVRALT